MNVMVSWIVVFIMLFTSEETLLYSHVIYVRRNLCCILLMFRPTHSALVGEYKQTGKYHVKYYYIVNC